MGGGSTIRRVGTRVPRRPPHEQGAIAVPASAPIAEPPLVASRPPVANPTRRQVVAAPPPVRRVASPVIDGSKVQSSIVPAACEAPWAWGQRTWRKPARAGEPERVLNLGYWNLCEIAYELQNAFLQHTNWSYLSISGGRSWLKERCQWLLDYDDPAKHEDKLLRDLLRMADIIHLNECHNHPALSDDLRGKRMAIHHHGCAYRNDPDKWDKAETRAGYLRLVSTPDLLVAGKPEYRATKHWLPSPLNLEELDRNFPRWEARDPALPLQVLHGYTVKANKGTDQFERIASEEIRRGTNLQLGFINHVQRRQSLWYMSQADIYFATFLYGPGAASYEAMAFGVPVILGCTPDEREAQCEAIGCKREALPFLWVTPRTCAETLRQLANEPALRAEYGRRGRAYVVKFHDLKPVAQRLRRLYRDAEPCREVLHLG